LSNKNSHYKLDFKVKSQFSDKNLNFKDFRRQWYWRGNGYDVPAARSIFTSYTKNNNVKNLIPADFNIDDVADKAGIDLSVVEKQQFYRYVNIGKEAWWKEYSVASTNYTTIKATYGDTGISSASPEKFDGLLTYLATKTAEYEKYNTAFSKWVNKRPGVIQVWETYCKNNNLTDELTLVNFAKIVHERDFRNDLENARPRTLKIGTLVQLKDSLKNNTNKDPFYWKKEHKDSPRLGMISKLHPNGAFGYGSRLLKIMWIATSEETTLMERDLKILNE